MATNLTPAQQKVLAFIKDFVARHRFAPTAKEIAENFGIAVVEALDGPGGLSAAEPPVVRTVG